MNDWLDSPEFKEAVAAYWNTSLHKYEKIDELRALIRARYFTPCPACHRRSIETEGSAS